MPRFFFDTDDGVRRVHDAVGMDLSSEVDIPSALCDLLFDLEHAEILKGDRRHFDVTIRNAIGVTVYKGTMMLDVEWKR